MHFHLPKPLHGWREFVGEVGIIVVGVLIALGAEQIVRDLHSRADERAFRETINHEIGLNLFMYDLRSLQFACGERHAAELKAWLEHARSGDGMPALWPSPPISITPYRGAWDNRDAQVFNGLSADTRQKYAEFYDELSNNWATMQRENEQWMRLVPYAESGPVSLTDRRAIRPVIVQIRDANALLQENLPISRKIADVLGAEEVRPDGLPADMLQQAAACRSAIASPTETAELNLRR